MLCAVESFAQTAEPNQGEGQKLVQSDAQNIQGILIVPNVADVNPAGVSGVRGVVIKGPGYFDQFYIEALLNPYLNAPLTKDTLDEIQVKLVKYCRARGHLVVDVFYREQDILEGTIQIAVIDGKVGKVTVENEGKRWFKDDLILKQLNLPEGEPIEAGRLSRDLNWLNRNNYRSLNDFDGTFRQVSARFKQGDLGETDILIDVEDRNPIRAYVGYEDSGIAVIGDNRWLGGLTWANAFGLDHRINYQYATDIDLDKFRSHSASYVMPLPWRHELTFFGSYSEIFPDFGQINPAFAGLIGDGSIFQTSARYSIPLPSTQNFNHEFSVGFDFKRTDTPLFFGTTAGLLSANNVDINQFTADYRFLVRDRLGQTSVSLQGVFSPGGLTGLNNDTAFNAFSAGADSEYAYGRIDVRRETPLGSHFSWRLKAAGQYAESQLLPSETFGVGGYSSVRGYNERSVNGDNGFLVSNELRTEWYELRNLVNEANATDCGVQFLAFVDYGKVFTRSPNPVLLERFDEALLSVGGGLRIHVSDNVRFRLDYGYQLSRAYLTAPSNLEKQNRGRVHLGLEIGF